MLGTLDIILDFTAVFQLKETVDDITGQIIVLGAEKRKEPGKS